MIVTTIDLKHVQMRLSSNEIDDNCDGNTDENGRPELFYNDADGDGFGTSIDLFVKDVVKPLPRQ